MMRLRKTEYEKSLTPEQLKALEMKFKGYTYKQIAAEVGKAVITIKHWFRKGGKLWEAYKKFQIEELNRIRGGAIKTLRDAATKAATTLVEFLDSHNENIRFRAAVEILNRLGIRLEIGEGELKRQYGGTTIIVTRGEYSKDANRNEATVIREEYKVKEGDGSYIGALPTLRVDKKREKIRWEKITEDDGN